MSGAIVVVGSINLDLVVRVARHPRPGETLIGTSVAEYPGGKGSNQAVAAARAGGVVRMIGRIGGDERGVVLREGLENDGVDVSHVQVCKHDPTGLALIAVDDAGENTIVVVSGANHKIRSAHIDAAASAGVFNGASVLLTQLETPIEVVSHALRVARACGLHTILNAAPAMTLGAELTGLLDVMIVNEHELAIITGINDRDEALRRAHRMASVVVLTLGSRGSIVIEGTVGAAMQKNVPAFPVVPVDTTGAGDAFCGAFAVAVSKGYSTENAAISGNAAGALAATKRGAQPSLPTASEIASLIELRESGS